MTTFDTVWASRGESVNGDMRAFEATASNYSVPARSSSSPPRPCDCHSSGRDDCSPHGDCFGRCVARDSQHRRYALRGLPLRGCNVSLATRKRLPWSDYAHRQCECGLRDGRRRDHMPQWNEQAGGALRDRWGRQNGGVKFCHKAEHFVQV
jgi:hypothetical protein